MKIKIGTQIDERVFRSLKVAAARENKALGTMLEEAVTAYLTRRSPGSAKNGLRRFLARTGEKIPAKAFKEILRSDYYDQ